MAKEFSTFEHTADIGLAASGDTLAELFEALAEGLCDVICSRDSALAAQSRNIEVQAEDVGALTVDFLEKVLWVIQVEHLVVSDVHVDSACRTSVAAEVLCEPYDSERHEILTDVKAVTYHQLKVAREGRRWIGRVVLDI
ncbi:MAG: archease [Planctomycetes bacterium]|nr:archease [Planctomycetota bacterium]